MAHDEEQRRLRKQLLESIAQDEALVGSGSGGNSKDKKQNEDQKKDEDEDEGDSFFAKKRGDKEHTEVEAVSSSLGPSKGKAGKKKALEAAAQLQPLVRAKTQTTEKQ